MLVQWNPQGDLSRLEHAMNHLFEGRAQPRANGETAQAAWQPPVDIFEDAERIVLVADLPGIEHKDLELTVDKNVLTFRGERKSPYASGPAAYHRTERVYGPFARSFTLPATVDPEKVGAELKNGVLSLTLPKKKEAQPRQIKVQIA